MSANNCIILILTLFVATAVSIRCFQCSSYEHPECADVQLNDTNSPFYKECEPLQNRTYFCRKTIQTVLDPRFTRITRSCGFYIHRKNESNCRKSDTDFKLETTCQCFTDACNSGNHFKPALQTLLYCTVILLSYRFI